MKVGKSKISITGKKFKELTQYPLALSVPQHQLKLFTVLHQDSKKFMLKVNGHSYSSFPYMYEPVSPFERNTILLNANITMNGLAISIPTPWNVLDMFNNIIKKLG